MPDGVAGQQLLDWSRVTVEPIRLELKPMEAFALVAALQYSLRRADCDGIAADIARFLIVELRGQFPLDVAAFSRRLDDLSQDVRL